MRKAKMFVAVAVVVAVSLGTAGLASAVDAPRWVAALYVEAQKMVGLRWTPVPGATGYNVLRSETPGAGHAVIASPATPQHFDKDLQPGVTYYYVLQAVVGAEVSGNSAEKSVAIPGEKKVEQVQPPKWDKIVPQVTMEFGKPTVKVGLFWQPSKGTIAAYNVYRSETAGSGYGLIGSLSETQYVDTTAEVGKTYYYVLSALDAATFMETSYSEEKSVEIKTVERKKKKKKEKVVQKFRVTNVLAKISRGEWGALSAPVDVDVDWDGGVVFVSNKADKHIYAFSLDGEFISKFNAATEENPKGIVEPAGLGWDPYSEVLYACDSGVSTIYMFDGEGSLQGSFPVLKEHGVTVSDKDPVVTSDVCVSGDGETVAIVDNGRHKVLLYDARGNFQSEISTGRKSAEPGSFTFPTRCVFNRNEENGGDLVVTDTFGARIQIRDAETEEWRFFGELGEVAGSFKSVVGIAVDRNNHIWTADKDNFVVTEFDYEGKYVSIVGQKELNDSGNYVLIMGTPVAVSAHPEKDELVVSNYYGATIYHLDVTEELVTGK